MSNTPKLQLHIPTPPGRPGDEPTFDHLDIPPAGSVRRPDISASESELRDLPYGLIRVLDDAGPGTRT